MSSETRLIDPHVASSRVTRDARTYILFFVLGVVGAYSMYKTDSLIGAVLFHAGYDLTIIVPVLNSG